MGLAIKLVAESDAKHVDLYSYWEKLKQHNPISVVTLGLLPSSVRRMSAKIVHNPDESETKELLLRFNIRKFTFKFKLVHVFIQLH